MHAPRSHGPLPRYALHAGIMLLLLVIALLPGMVLPAAAAPIDIIGPAGSEVFGQMVTVLPNGNMVVVDSRYDAENVIDVGAVYLYNSSTRALISTLTGTTAYDYVGDGGIKVLSNGNYVIHSSRWDNGSAKNAGAVTWSSGTTGLTGAVSVANSLVGTTANEYVGAELVVALRNGNYVVHTPSWSFDKGAVTWGSGTTGVTGTISAANSLVGRSGDNVGAISVVVLSNGNYVVRSPYWNNGLVPDVGAATWGNG